jgi:multiple sugar transport system substrate-binding protein
VQGETQWVADFIAAGYVYDLTDLFSSWEDWEHYYPILRELATFDGRIMGVPGGTTISWFYRKDVLEQAGISTEQPNTWEDFYTVCGEIKEKTTAQPCGLPAATAWGGGTWGEGFKMVWLSFEGTIYDEADQKWVVRSPNLLKAFQVYETLAKNEWLTVQELLTPNPWEPIKYQEFPQGETVLVTGGDWQWQFDWGPNGATPIEGLFEKVDRWRFSAETGEPFVFVRGGVNTWINARSVAPEGAFEYLKHRDTPEVACETYPLYLGGPTGRDDTGGRCEFYRNAVNGKMVEADGFFQTGRTLRTYVGETKIADGVARATEDIITLKRTAEEAMSDFAQAMKDTLGEAMVKDA